MVSKATHRKNKSGRGSRSEDRGRRKRRPYQAPQLEILGSLNESTLGGSPGVGDSANPTTTKP